jgi:YHS domain-containing protein
MCPVSGHACDPDAKAMFEGGEVCFCCEKCALAFVGDPTTFAAKARHQLVVTGQLVQKGCPLSGGPVKAGTQIDVGGVPVGFCCGNCQGKVAKAAADEQVSLVFGSGKGFALAQ